MECEKKVGMPVKTYLKEILNILETMSDDNKKETTNTRSDATQLGIRIQTFKLFVLSHFWNEILSRIDRVQKRLQDHSINFHNAALDLKSLRNHFVSHRVSLVEQSIENGLLLSQKFDVQV